MGVPVLTPPEARQGAAGLCERWFVGEVRPSFLRQMSAALGAPSEDAVSVFVEQVHAKGMWVEAEGEWLRIWSAPPPAAFSRQTDERVGG